MNSLSYRSRQPYQSHVLVIIVISISLLIAYIATYALTRISALEYVEATNGHVQYAPQPEWWPGCIPLPFWMRTITLVHIGELRESNVRMVTPLHELTILVCSGETFDDDDIAYISAFPRLQRLTVEHASVTDSGMPHLKSCMRLEELSLPSPEIGDSGIACLSQLPLRSLTVSKSRVTDDGLAVLRGLPLNAVDLSDTRITNAGLKHLADLPLKELSLAGTRVRDITSAELPTDSLGYLDVRYTKVTETGLTSLIKVRSLFALVVSPEMLTDDEVNSLLAQGLPLVREP